MARRPEGDHPVRWSRIRCTSRAPLESTGHCSPAARPRSASATASRRWLALSVAHVAHTGLREFGRTAVGVDDPGTLLAELPATCESWMSPRRLGLRAPHGFTVLASSSGAPIAAFEDPERSLAGVQWHPEVHAHQRGQLVLENFLYDIAGCRPDWTAANIVDESVAAIQQQVGGKHMICGLSGGVDSAVAAALVQRAVGDQLTCVFVDHGLLRKGEAEQVERDLSLQPASTSRWSTRRSSSFQRCPE